MKSFKFLLITLAFLISDPLFGEEVVKPDPVDEAKKLLAAWEIVKAHELLLPHAEKGNVRAQILLGNSYINHKKDLETGREWLKRAADSGDKTGIFQLGLAYIGRKNPEDDKKGIHLIQQAADKNNTDAMNQLSLGYRMGWWGLPKDEKQATFWREKAINFGQ